MIEIIKAIIFGIVEGITEWLPISSTGHMILVDEFIHLGGGKEFVELFLVVVQLGSILAVCLLYFNKLNPFSKGKRYEERKQTIRLWIRVLIACVPAGVIGVLFNDEIKEIFFNSKVINDLSFFKNKCDLIVANRINSDLADVMDKVYSRDIYCEE